MTGADKGLVAYEPDIDDLLLLRGGVGHRLDGPKSVRQLALRQSARDASPGTPHDVVSAAATSRRPNMPRLRLISSSGG